MYQKGVEGLLERGAYYKNRLQTVGLLERAVTREEGGGGGLNRVFTILLERVKTILTGSHLLMDSL